MRIAGTIFLALFALASGAGFLITLLLVLGIAALAQGAES